jgi:peptide/nickel transport system substrate-binding protein
VAQADQMPVENNLSGLDYDYISRDDIFTYGALAEYSEAPMLAELVAAGKLPPLAERLPAEPLIFKTGAMVDGIGEYGGVFRHVIGGRPEGWNWMAGQHQGWGGINMAIQECLVRQGPRWEVKAEDQTGPLANLARSWTWSDDKTELTIDLMQGVKWSDGDPFDVEDIRFWYEDNVQNEKVSTRMAKDSFGGGAAFEVIDEHTFKFTFPSPQAETLLEGLAYIQGCPGPSHVLKETHPDYNTDSTYEQYVGSQPNDLVPPVVLGAWVPVVHQPDELVVMRRNPYYFKVDESGQQLPYMNEMHFRLSTWDDRTTQAVAGTGDFSNLEDPGNFVEALKQSQSDDSPVAANFGPRVVTWRLQLNFNEGGAKDDTEIALRNLFRETDFRLALSHALDRDAIGQALARGPFAYPYISGFATGSPYYDEASSDYHPFDQAKAGALLDGLGVSDTDDNGVRNMPGGEDLLLEIQYQGDLNADRKQVEALASQLDEIGIKTVLRSLDETTVAANRASGAFSAVFVNLPVILPTREVCETFPAGTNCPNFNSEGNRLPFETELEQAYASFVATGDPAEQAELAKTMQRLMTENAYFIGTVQVPAAMLVNKRIKNVHPGTPVFMYEWAEDSVIRERLWTPADQQIDEILPGTIAEY